MIVDNESPPGSWRNEMAACPTGYGQATNKKLEFALAAIRQHGCWAEATTVVEEITRLKTERDMAARVEREECARLCDAFGMPDWTSQTAQVLAAAIRARGGEV